MRTGSLVFPTSNSSPRIEARTSALKLNRRSRVDSIPSEYPQTLISAGTNTVWPASKWVRVVGRFTFRRASTWSSSLRPRSREQVHHDDLNGLPVLVQRRAAELHGALARPARGRAHLKDFRFDVQLVSRAHRARPLHLVGSSADDSAGGTEIALDQQLHRQRGRVPSARGEPVEEGAARGLCVRVERLRVELRRERLDRGRINLQLA